MNYQEAIQICERFALRHELIFRKEGEVGFGRPCCGFLAGNSAYVDYNPERVRYRGQEINPSIFEKVEEFHKVDLSPPDTIHHAYEKHECLAVIHHWAEDAENENSPAIVELATWVQDMERKAAEAGGELFVGPYEHGWRGLAGIFHGPGPKYAIGVR